MYVISCWTTKLTTIAITTFPNRREKSVSSDADYAAKSHKKKFFLKNGGGARAIPDAGYVDSDGAWRRGAARKVVTYDEAQADYGLDSDEDVNDDPVGDLAIECEDCMLCGGKWY